MYPKTRDLEIVCNLVWRSKSQSDDRAIIVGMYDVPSTTLNLETFKSYLLKNSGSAATDIKVSYITSDEKEVPINDQNDFQLALYAFRRRARIGEIITLKVDKVAACKTIGPLVQSSDVEIQTSDYKDEAMQQTNAQLLDDQTPPKWFTKHMKKFEKKILDDIKQQLTLNSYRATHNTPYYSNSSRTKKPESHRRSRKVEFVRLNLDKEMCKKYAFKLDEPENAHRPSLKTKSKKLNKINKISSDSDVCVGRDMATYELSKKLRQSDLTPQITAVEHSPPASPKAMNFYFTDLSCPLNDVLLGSSGDEKAGPLYTNSVYLQKWEVTNAGMNAWDENTELRYAWGSEKLRPTMTILKCPELKPGEKGEITVWFQIPSTPGSYECFWHFYDCGRRFGRWIGCQLNVIDYPRKNHSPYATQPLDVSSTSHPTVVSSTTSCVASVGTLISAAKVDPIDLSLASVPTHALSSSTPASLTSVQSQSIKQNTESLEIRKFTQIDNCVADSVVATKRINANDLDCISIQSQSQSQSNCEPSSDSDNISILSGAQTPRSGSSDYVVIPSPNSSSDETKSYLASQREESASANLIIASVDEDIGIEHNNEKLLVLSDASNNNLDAVSVASEAKSEPAVNISEEDDVEEELRSLQNLKMADVQHEQSEYAYIYYNGEKYPIHKDFLHVDYFNEAEKCAQSLGSVGISSKSSVEYHDSKEDIAVCSNIDASTTMQGQGSRTRQESTSSQESSKRLFVFPRHSPGFEVVYPVENTCVEQPSPSATSAGTANSGYNYEGDEYFSLKDGFQFPPASENQFHTDRAPSLPTMPTVVNVESEEGFSLQELLEIAERDAQRVSSTTGFAHSAHALATTDNTTDVCSQPLAAGRNEIPPSCDQRFKGHVHRPSPVQPGKKENVMTAALLAGSAMGSVRNMVNKVLSTGNGKWINGHWVAEGENTKRANGLKILAEMGFMNRDLNATLLARYNDDVHRVISELVQ